jgi:hypothetical protein
VPRARVSTVAPFTRSRGPSPHRSGTRAPRGDRNGRTPGTATSVICGDSPGKRRVRRVVRIAWNDSFPSGPIRPCRHCPRSPSTRTCSRPPLTPGGRLIVTSPTQSRRRHDSDSDGSVSPLAGTQVVAGSSSKADRAVPAGSLVAVELAVTLSRGSVLRYFCTSEVSVSAAVPVRRAFAAASLVRTRMKRYPSSSPRWSAGEQTQRTEPCMQPVSRPGPRAITTVPSPGVAGTR